MSDTPGLPMSGRQVEVVCGTCDGKGEVPVFDSTIEQSVTGEWEKCWPCDGTGTTPATLAPGSRDALLLELGEAEWQLREANNHEEWEKAEHRCHMATVALLAAHDTKEERDG